jgi:hypothetical protein
MEVKGEGKTNFVGSNLRYFREEGGVRSLRFEQSVTCLCREMLLKGQGNEITNNIFTFYPGFVFDIFSD